jgi:hypothetical protein
MEMLKYLSSLLPRPPKLPQAAKEDAALAGEAH